MLFRCHVLKCLQANRIPVLDRHVVLHRLEETSAGVWEPVLFQR